MSRRNYPNWHEIKDLVMIYHEQEWDDAEVMVWDPINRKELRLTFSGSTRPEEDHEGFGLDIESRGQINFTVWPLKETWLDRLKWKITTMFIKLRLKIEKACA